MQRGVEWSVTQAQERPNSSSPNTFYCSVIRMGDRTSIRGCDVQWGCDACSKALCNEEPAAVQGEQEKDLPSPLSIHPKPGSCKESGHSEGSPVLAGEPSISMQP